MYCYHNNQRIKFCKDCSFFGFETGEIDGQEVTSVDGVCTPVKPKYGANPVAKNQMAGKLDFCRLTNEVDDDFILDFGTFAGQRLGDVKFKAPKYVAFLLKNNIITLK
jgi:hypothetical protein